jgi:SsrA-binding protein
VSNGEAWLEGVHIPKYEHGTYINHEPERTRKLLLHRAQITELRARSQAQGYTIVPLRLYFRSGRAKLELALAKGKKAHDKREVAAERDWKRDQARLMREKG